MKNAPPSKHEFEMTLFGNGYGESILLHACDNKWIIIDSCINPLTKKIAPIEYLESIGVDASNQVKLLVISHWHDDHIKGVLYNEKIKTNGLDLKIVALSPLDHSITTALVEISNLIPKAGTVVEKILKESTKSRVTLNSFGYITLRKNVLDEKDDWQIITQGHATKL